MLSKGETRKNVEHIRRPHSRHRRRRRDRRSPEGHFERTRTARTSRGSAAKRWGVAPAHCYYGPVGGESPIRYLHEAAQRIARGECSVAAICGAEAQSTATKAQR